MKNAKDTGNRKLDRIITIRLRDEEYETLSHLCKDKGSNISEVIRTFLRPLVALTEKNNRKK